MFQIELEFAKEGAVGTLVRNIQMTEERVQIRSCGENKVGWQR